MNMGLISNINRIKKIIEHNNILTEASKEDILINKIGIDPEKAKEIVDILGKRSVWYVNKLIDFIVLRTNKTKEDAVSEINTDNNFIAYKSLMRGISDYLSVALNNNISTIKDLNFDEINQKVVEWHQSLRSNKTEINYKETHPIVLDFRDENGEGFYWVDLETNSSSEECERMGHCGRTSAGDTLYSLRSYKRIEGTDNTRNSSHLTLSLGLNNGIMFQLKGKKNSKPSPKYHKYILPLFKLMVTDYETNKKEPLIKGTGYEYESSKDFKIFDLDDLLLQKLYDIRPDLFRSIYDKVTLIGRGITINSKDEDFITEVKMSFYDWNNVFYNLPISVGKINGEKINMINGAFKYPVQLLEAEGFYTRSAMKFIIEYYLNAENTRRLFNILTEDVDADNLEYFDIGEIIDFYGDVSFIEGLVDITGDITGDNYIKKIKESTIKNIEDKIGKIINIDDDGFTVRVDFSKLHFHIGDEGDREYLDKLISVAKRDLERLFRMLIIEDFIEFEFDNVPKVYDEFDVNEFNEIMSQYLDKFE